MIVRAILLFVATILCACSEFAPPSWGMLTPSPLIKVEKANGTRNSITIPYDFTSAYKYLGLPDDYRVVYNYSFEYPNNPFMPPSTGYTYIYGSKGATYEWWRPPRTEDGRSILRGVGKQQQRPAPTYTEPNDDRVWIPIGQDQGPAAKPVKQTIIHTAPLYGASPVIYILGNSDEAGEHKTSIDGPVENRERDYPPGFFAANRDDDRSFALLRRFAADRDDEGFARFAADKDEDGFARFAAIPSRFSNDPSPLVMNRNDLLWTRR